MGIDLPDIGNPSSGLDNNQGEQTEQSSDELLLDAKKKILNLKEEGNDDKYNAGLEEYSDLEQKFADLKENVESDYGALLNEQKEFFDDLAGLDMIGELDVDNAELQRFFKQIGSDVFTESTEEKIYDLFNRKIDDVEDYLDNGGKLPSSEKEALVLVNGIEKVIEAQEEFLEFSDNLKKIDISEVSTIELKDYIKELQKYEEFGFSFGDIISQVKLIKEEFGVKEIVEKQIKIKTEESEDKKEESEDKKEESEDKKEESEDKKEESEDKKEESEDKKEESEDKKEESEDKKEESEDKKEESEEYASDEIESNIIREKKVNSFLSVNKILLSSGISLPGLDVDIFKELKENNNSKIEGRNEEVRDSLIKLEAYFKQKDNLLPLFKELKKIDKDSGNKGKDSLYNKMYNELGNISPGIKQSLESFIPKPGFEGKKHREDSTEEEAELSGIIAGNPDNIGDAIKLSEGKYLLGDKEFDFTDGEAKVSTVGDNGYKIELGKISKNDLQVLDRINGKMDESSMRLGNLENELGDLENQLRIEQDRYVGDGGDEQQEQKITELVKKIEAKKERIQKMQQLIDGLMVDKKSEERELSKFITNDKKEKVDKSQNILAITGATRFLSESFINEFIARINLSPSLRKELGFVRPIDLSEGVLGFDEKLGDSDQRRKFGELLNAIFSGDIGGPLNIDAIKNGKSGYGMDGVEAKVRGMISQNLNVVGTPDINRALNNIRKSRIIKTEEM